MDPTLHVWNRSLHAAASLAGDASLGPTVLDSAAQLAGAAVTFCMLANDSVVEEVSCSVALWRS